MHIGILNKYFNKLFRKNPEDAKAKWEGSTDSISFEKDPKDTTKINRLSKDASKKPNLNKDPSSWSSNLSLELDTL